MPEETLNAKIVVDPSQALKSIEQVRAEIRALKKEAESITANVKTNGARGGAGKSAGGSGKSSGGSSNAAAKAAAANLEKLAKVTADAVAALRKAAASGDKAAQSSLRVAEAMQKVLSNANSAAKTTDSVTASMKELLTAVKVLRHALEKLAAAAQNARVARPGKSGGAAGTAAGGKPGGGNGKGGKGAATKQDAKPPASDAAPAPADTNPGATATADKDRRENKNRTKQIQANTANLNKVTKGLAVVAAALHLVKAAVMKMGSSLDRPANLYAASQIVGIDYQKYQRMRNALIPFGGDENGPFADFMAMQRNLELAKRGGNPFGEAAWKYMGDRLTVTPGMTQEEFMDNIAERLQQLTLEQAMAAGRDMGLSEPMIMFLRKYGKGWRKEMESSKNEPTFSNEQGKDSTETKRIWTQIGEQITRIWNLLANKLLHGWDNSPGAKKGAGATGFGGQVVAAIVTAAAAVMAYAKLFAKKANAAAIPALMVVRQYIEDDPYLSNSDDPFPRAWRWVTGARGPEERAEEWRRERGKQLEEEYKKQGFSEEEAQKKAKSDVWREEEAEFREAVRLLQEKFLRREISVEKYHEILKVLKRAFPGHEVPSFIARERTARPDENTWATTDTPLNNVDNEGARQMGMASGRGETKVDVGGVTININAPGGDPEKIKVAVAQGSAGAAEAVRQEFEYLDMTFSTEVLA